MKTGYLWKRGRRAGRLERVIKIGMAAQLQTLDFMRYVLSLLEMLQLELFIDINCKVFIKKLSECSIKIRDLRLNMGIKYVGLKYARLKYYDE